MTTAMDIYKRIEALEERYSELSKPIHEDDILNCMLIDIAEQLNKKENEEK